jgi:hypothetical protein
LLIAGSCLDWAVTANVSFPPIADIRISLQNGGMRLLQCFGVLLALASCQEVKHAALKQQSSETSTLPVSKERLNTAAYHLRVDRAGTLGWNGAVVNEATLRDYLGEFSRRPEAAGTLSVEFEPGTSATTTQKVRRDVIDSGLCRQRRCLEIKWGTPTAIVN